MPIDWTEFPERVEKFGDLFHILETFFRDVRVGLIHSGSCDKESKTSAYTVEFMDGGEFKARPERIPGWEQLATAVEREYHRELSLDVLRGVRGFISEVKDVPLAAVNEMTIAEVAEIFDAARPQPPSSSVSPADPLLNEYRWLKVTQVAKLFALAPGQVSKAADAGTFVSNLKNGHDRRIDVLSVVKRELERLNRGDSTGTPH